MRNAKALMIAFVVVALAAPAAFGQRKKELKTTVEELTVENQQLKKNTDLLQKRNKDILDEKASLETEVKRLQQDYVSVKDENDNLRKQLALSGGKTGGGGSTGGGGGNTGGGGNAGGGSAIPDNSPCVKQGLALKPNISYFKNMSELKHGGWGVQVYSFGTLCQAQDKAEEFRKSYKLYNTYVRVKEVDGQKVFSVVYGSLKDYEQAKVYCTNFRKISKDEAGKEAFVVVH